MRILVHIQCYNTYTYLISRQEPYRQSITPPESFLKKKKILFETHLQGIDF